MDLGFPGFCFGVAWVAGYVLVCWVYACCGVLGFEGCCVVVFWFAWKFDFLWVV